MMITIMILTTIIAGAIQGITGFGGSIVMMMVLPTMYALPQGAGISTAICIFLNLSMLFMYRKYIDFKKVILPSILYMVVCSIAIYFSTNINQELMKKVFGIFLIILAIYYLFIQKGDPRKKLSLTTSLFCIIASALCDAFFGIGGPLMVLYFLSQTHNTHEYLGTIQSFFFVNTVYNTCFRFYNGILGVEHLSIIGIGIIGILIGSFIGNKIVDKLDGVLIKKLTYFMIGISGFINLF